MYQPKKIQYLLLQSCMRMLGITAISLCLAYLSNAQNFTTKGVEFWAAYGNHANMYNSDGSVRTDGGSQKMVFYFLSNKPTNVTVEIPAIGWKKKYKVTFATATETEEMPKTGVNDTRLLTEGVSNKGIHITSDERITVYCHIYDTKSSATTLLIPVNIAGQEYYTLNYAQRSDVQHGRSYCFVVATEDSTTIEVVPAGNTVGHTAGVPFIQKLNKGEVLNLLGATTGKAGNSYSGADLTGTYIHTVNQSAAEGCKKVIVFSGSSAINIMCSDDVKNSSDNLLQQTPPIEGWGNYYITVPTLKMPMNKYRVMVLYPDQKVYLNGLLLTNPLQGRYYEFQTNIASVISSDNLMLVAQYITTAAKCGNNQLGEGGDPEMIYLIPLGNGINTTVINATTHNNITEHYINVVMKTSNTDSFKLDGKTMPHRFTMVGRNPVFSTAQIEVTPGRHVLQADSSLQTYAYGYGEGESYGYNGGFAIKHVSGEIGLTNQYLTIADSLTTCAAAPFRLYFDVEVKLTYIEWSFSNNSKLYPNGDVRLQPEAPDSTYQKGFTTYYRYYLPGYYQYSTSGEFPVDILAYLPDARGCISKKNFSQTITVLSKPSAKWLLDYDHCTNKILTFTDKSESYGNTSLLKWDWSFGDGTTSTERNPQQQYSGYGEYNVQLQVANDAGCRADTTAMIGLYHKPLAAFEVSGSICSKEDVYFTSTGVVEDDELLQWKWDFTDGTTSNMPNPVKQFAGGATYEVKLVTKSRHGCIDTIAKLVRIYQTPEINLPPYLYVFAGDTLTLKPGYRGLIKGYNWMPATYLSSSNSPYPFTRPGNDITYKITVLGEGPCKATANTTVKLQRKLDVPNVFSPNGDGTNDTWHIKNIEGYPACGVEVFNRWGSRVFYTKNYTAEWNGSFNGHPLPAGTYYYIINTNSTVKNTVLSGSITILK